MQLFCSLITVAAMTRHCGWVLPTVVALLWSVLASASDGQAGDIASILKQFPGYHVLTLQERDPDARAYIAQHSPRPTRVSFMLTSTATATTITHCC